VSDQPDNRIVYQGVPGANSHIACHEVYPDMEAVPCRTFEDALAAIAEGRAALGMIPVENTVAGRVADIHHLLPESDLSIVGEHFLRVRHQLMGVKGASLDTVKRVHSHPMALGQCRKIIRELALNAVTAADTAGAAQEVAALGGVEDAAIASGLAAQIYCVDVLRADVEDAEHNTTRFLILARDGRDAALGDGLIITSFVFRVRNVPAALYKAMGGFATNGVNMTKLESYQLDGRFTATQFYADIEGHPDERRVHRALEELAFFTTHLKILGVYPASPLRANIPD
jgi:prephenate dehydratase